MLIRCPKDQGELKKLRKETSQTVAGHTFSKHVPAQECRKCGEIYYEAEVLGRFELEVAAALAEAGITSGEAIRWMRKAVGIGSGDLAALLDVRPETVSRWEHSKKPIDRGDYATLHQLVLERLKDSTATKDFLTRLAKPKRLPKLVRLDDEAA